MQKRLDEEVRIFPNDESALPLIGALLAEQNKVWQEKHYLDMSECVERPPLCVTAREDNKLVALSDQHHEIDNRIESYLQQNLELTE